MDETEITFQLTFIYITKTLKLEFEQTLQYLFKFNLSKRLEFSKITKEKYHHLYLINIDEKFLATTTIFKNITKRGIMFSQ